MAALVAAEIVPVVVAAVAAAEKALTCSDSCFCVAPVDFVVAAVVVVVVAVEVVVAVAAAAMAVLRYSSTEAGCCGQSTCQPGRACASPELYTLHSMALLYCYC